MTRPRLLDLFCGAGGAAMGYSLAGFEVVGVDIAPQPRYPFEFHQADALTWPLDGFDAIHASPPCQLYSAANNIHQRTDHPDLIPPTRTRLVSSGVPWVLENVERSPMSNYVVLCGLAFPELNVRRHRWFECSFPVLVPPCGDHSRDYLIVFGGGAARTRAHQTGTTKNGGPIIHRGTASWADSCSRFPWPWMNRPELSEAIPPPYTRHLGQFLMVALEAAAA